MPDRDVFHTHCSPRAIPLSVRLTGFTRTPDTEPLGVEITDRANAGMLSAFTLPERAALVALCQSIVDAATEGGE